MDAVIRPDLVGSVSGIFIGFRAQRELSNGTKDHVQLLVTRQCPDAYLYVPGYCGLASAISAGQTL
jgi:hypothetical protein